ncbi:WD40 repeat-like protein [Rhizopogon vinicolor AM-OR11-026]|uniref:WD40 repeat-like protein n=1 Tax=Rhizopogon vinicolor AM-OR11-026 TaxID=1314800 RepID=A0A1B7MJ35_9AGAM|nr:WD40 repeat-like protein [Rhizopogon vinicolor AM-OR11-026]
MAKTLQGHSRTVTCIDISMDIKPVASGSTDSTVRIWDLNTGELMAGPFECHLYFNFIAYFPNGKQIISGSDDKSVRRWDLQAGKEIEEARVVCEKEVFAVAVSRDGRWVVTGGGNFMGLWGLKPTGTVKTLQGHLGTITCLDISMDNTLVASGSTDSTPRIWDLNTGKLVAGPLETHTQHITGLALSFDCALLASASSDRTIKLWAFESRQLLASFNVQHDHSLILSPDSRQLAYATSEQNLHIHICDIPPEILASIWPPPSVCIHPQVPGVVMH